MPVGTACLFVISRSSVQSRQSAFPSNVGIRKIDAPKTQNARKKLTKRHQAAPLGMAKRPNFTHRLTPKGWQVDVPESMSRTGKRERRFFAVESEAKRFTARLREQYHAGQRGGLIPLALALDAAEASRILEPHGVSLVEAAKAFAARAAADDRRDVRGSLRPCSARKRGNLAGTIRPRHGQGASMGWQGVYGHPGFRIERADDQRGAEGKRGSSMRRFTRTGSISGRAR